VSWQAVTERVAASLLPAGIDLLAPFGHGDPPRLRLIAGNTAALWPRFLSWLAEDRARAELPHPLETYVEQAMTRATADVPAPCVVRYAHDGPPWPPIQRLAEKAGLAWLSPANLAIHPTFGPWISLRAIIDVEVVGPFHPPPPAPRCPACAGACVPAFERACATLDPADATASMRAHFAEWLAVRDSCPTGRAHRFDDDQLRYGYTGDRGILR
jgi:hypothetical protein